MTELEENYVCYFLGEAINKIECYVSDKDYSDAQNYKGFKITFCKAECFRI